MQAPSGSKRWPRAAALALLIVSALVGCSSEPEPSDFRVGMSREELVDEFGEPDDRQSLVKSASKMWGPMESLWASAPVGARIEIWSYTIRDGRVELYFVDGSPEVKGKGFAPAGAVF